MFARTIRTISGLVEAACTEELGYFVPEAAAAEFVITHKTFQSRMGKEHITKSAELEGTVGTNSQTSCHFQLLDFIFICLHNRDD